MMHLLRAAAIVLGAGLLPAQEPDFLVRTAPYDAETLDAVGRMPVQDEGRVKPLLSLVRVTLLQVHERAGGVQIPDEPRFGPLAGEKLSPEEWALDMLLYPQQAAHYPVFVVTDRDVLDVLNLSSVARRKRDRYSWNELSPGYDRAGELHEEYSRIPAKEQTRLQSQVVQLARDLFGYASMAYAFEAARRSYDVTSGEALKEVFAGQERVRFSDVVGKSRILVPLWRELDRRRAQIEDQDAKREFQALGALLHQALFASESAEYVVWLPPAAPLGEREAWWSLRDLVASAPDVPAEQRERELAVLRHLEAACDATDRPAERDAALLAWATGVRELAEERGELRGVDLEVFYHRFDAFYRAVVTFLLGFVLASASWLLPRARWLRRAAIGVTGLATAFVVFGIAMRCILLARPPILGLYDTLPYIGACGAIAGLVMEAINRRGIGVSLAAFLGTAFLFATRGFEHLRAQDTLEEVQAVLRTNFWLATHVTTVTLGYAATVLAGLIASVFLVGKLIGIRRSDTGWYRELGRMVYGTLCFGLFFATIGTILGGIWANDSWGRFWGWDPKENGALLIVLWGIMILHARLAGLIRNFGICILAVIGSAIVGFSWGYTNVMEVGLHSYGFQPGLFRALVIFWTVHGVIAGLGLLAWALERHAQQAPPVQRRDGRTAALEDAVTAGASGSR